MSELTMDQQLRARLDTLEGAVIGLARMELGDVAGHDFHGNQWKDMSDGDLQEHAAKVLDELKSREAAKAKLEDARKMQQTAVSTTGRNPIADHLVKGRREAEIVDTARAQGLIPAKGSVTSTGHYGDNPERPAAILPTQTKIHLARPEENDYPAHDGKYTVVQSAETGHLRAIGGSFDAPLGATVHLQHDQSGARMGDYRGHEIVGEVHGDGTATGVIPDRKIAYSVFK